MSRRRELENPEILSNWMAQTGRLKDWLAKFQTGRVNPSLSAVVVRIRPSAPFLVIY